MKACLRPLVVTAAALFLVVSVALPAGASDAAVSGARQATSRRRTPGASLARAGRPKTVKTRACAATLRQLLADAVFDGPSGRSRLYAAKTSSPGSLLSPGTGGATPQAAVASWGRSSSARSECPFVTTSYLASGLNANLTSLPRKLTPHQRVVWENEIINGDARALDADEVGADGAFPMTTNALGWTLSRTILSTTVVKRSPTKVTMRVVLQSSARSPTGHASSTEPWLVTVTRIGRRWYVLTVLPTA